MSDLTIIIPCYNKEKYVDYLINKLDNQTMKDFDVIFVNDCSSDNTLKLLEEKIKGRKNFSLIDNEKNSGAGASRNKALEKTNTKYVMFLDADDVFPDDYVEYLYKNIKTENNDMSICDIQVAYDDSFDNRPNEYNKIFKKDKPNKMELLENILVASPCNKIFKTELIKNNLFAEGIINEDIPAIIGSVIDAKKIGYVRNVYYTYIQHRDSVQNSRLSEKKLDVFKAMDMLYERKKGNKYLEKATDALVYNQLIAFFFFGICQERNFKVRKEFIKKFYYLSKDYNLRNNRFYWNFIDSSPKLVGVYYKAVFKAMCKKQFWLSSFIVSSYFTYKKFKKSNSASIVKYNITLKDLVSAAKKNQRATEEYGTLSVIVPNYNYANYLYRRLYSILYQEVKISEILILDDCSKDNSLEVIKELEDALKDIIPIRVIINEQNSGCVYKQWQKGFQNSKSKFVWIAEADDYSDKEFLKEVMPPLVDDDVYLSYSDSSFMLVNGVPTLRSMDILIDLMKTKHWEKDYINDGINEIENYEFLNCTIANASSVVFRNGDYDEEFKESTKYKQVGDWLFYVNIMKKGKIAYRKKSLNYCCIHEGSSTATTKKITHFNEIKSLHERFLKEYNVDPSKQKYIRKRYEQLRKEWNMDDLK